MTSTPDSSDALPVPGREGAAETTAEGLDDTAEGSSAGREGDEVLRRLERSAAGPGAGEEDIVRVETDVQHEGDADVTRHPTLRGSRQQDRERSPSSARGNPAG